VRNIGRVVASVAGATVTMSVLVGPGLATAAPPEARSLGKKADAVAEGPLVFGHRGASGYRPEHTLASYRLAIQMGADYVEPDLVATKDRVLVARHENEITATTDVEARPEFASRKATKTIDGIPITGWFTEDFTLAELKTLRAEERIPDIRQENTLYNGRYQVPTFEEVIDLVQAESKRLRRTIGIAPETKHPTYFDSIGLSMEEPLVNALNEAGLFGRRAPVVVQSFETANLRQLNRLTRVPLLQLIGGSGAPYDRVVAGSTDTYDTLLTDAGLRAISRYADWIGPDKNRIVPRTATQALAAPTDLVDRAHAAGLKVVPYTLRNENTFLPLEFRIGTDPSAYGNAFAEYDLFFSLGVDGVFTDNPDTAVEARESEPAPVPLQLLALNDFHGQLEAVSGSTGTIAGVPAGGSEYLATQIAQLTAAAGAAKTVTVAAGDLIGASPLLSAAFHDEPAIESLGLAGLDYASVGNHEFDEGADELLRIQNGGCHPTDGCADGTPYEGAGFQYLSANAFRTATGEPLLAPYAIEDVRGVKVGFIGMTLEGTSEIVSQQGIAGLDFADEVETANRYAAELQGQGVEAIVVLLHQGGSQAAGSGINDCAGFTGPVVDIANGMSDAIDVIVSGHTHQAYNCQIDGKLVTSASSAGRLVTDIDLTLDPTTGDVLTARAQNVVVTRDVPAAAAQTELIARYRTALGPLASRQVGEAAVALTREADRETLFGEVRGESPLGNVIADAQLAATDDEQGAVAAFMNPGGVRTDLDAGPVTYEEAFTVQPFANNLVTLDLTGAQLYCMLEQQFTVNRVLYPSSSVGYVVDPAGTTAAAGAPCAGSRIVAGSLTLGGQVVQAEDTYRVTVNNFLAGGGDGFTTLREGTGAVTGALDLDALVNYLQASSPVAAPALDRIRTTSQALAPAA
jgi:5'-nucleotidase